MDEMKHSTTQGIYIVCEEGIFVPIAQCSLSIPHISKTRVGVVGN
jgi:hypothetical protein